MLCAEETEQHRQHVQILSLVYQFLFNESEVGVGER